MNQPELGRKIIELRKSKGLTQDELASKCNLNIRTLQRIESGEVTPRANTLKLLLPVLDYDFDYSLETKTNQGIVSLWLEQFFKYVLDLFNLKTNAMKKITTLTVILSLIVVGFFILPGKTNAQKENGEMQSPIKNHRDEKPHVGLAFSFFNCKSCFDDGSEIIGRDVKFELSGVYVSVILIKLNQKSNEFKTSYMKGKIFQNRIELYIPEGIFIEGINEKEFEFKANTIDKTDTKVLLKGNSSFVIDHEYIQDTIKSEEISIFAF